jgi:Domain of unknown function (DUF4124)
MTISASTVRRLFALTLLLCLMPWAQAQWSWKDQDGRRIFSDQPPPPNVPEKDILKRPTGARAAAEPVPAPETASAGGAPAATSPALKISGKDPELDKRKKEAQAKEAARKKAEEEKVASAKRENCERAKRAKASFDSGQRMATLNSKGEREFISDATRSTETQRLQEIINSDCG